MTNDEAMAILICKAIQFANLAAGEGISIEGLEPETFLFDYSTATGDDEWETLADRTATALAALLAERDAAVARAERAKETERKRIVDALRHEASVTPCDEDAAIVADCADLVECNFSYEDVEKLKETKEWAALPQAKGEK